MGKIERYFSFHLSESYTEDIILRLKKTFSPRKFPIICCTFRKFDYFFHFLLDRYFLILDYRIDAPWNYESTSNKSTRLYVYLSKEGGREKANRTDPSILSVSCNFVNAIRLVQFD